MCETYHQTSRTLMEQNKYRVLLAVDSKSGRPIGCASLFESHALYADGGTFGNIQEFYIEPDFRSRQAAYSDQGPPGILMQIRPPFIIQKHPGILTETHPLTVR